MGYPNIQSINCLFNFVAIQLNVTLCISDYFVIILGTGQHSGPDTTLEAFSEDQMYTSFGLGYGVDASDPSALRSRHGKVRTILSNLSNVEESLGNRRDTYKQEISSLVSHKASVNFSVSDLVGKVLTLSTEAEYAREKTREMIAKGTRTSMVHHIFTHYQKESSKHACKVSLYFKIAMAACIKCNLNFLICR